MLHNNLLNYWVHWFSGSRGTARSKMNWPVTDAHFLRLAHNNREAGLPKLMLLRPLGRTFVIMGYNFNNRELLEVTDIKIFNLSFVNKGTHRSFSDRNIETKFGDLSNFVFHALSPARWHDKHTFEAHDLSRQWYFVYLSTNEIASTESGTV